MLASKGLSCLNVCECTCWARYNREHGVGGDQFIPSREPYINSKGGCSSIKASGQGCLHAWWGLEEGRVGGTRLLQLLKTR